MSKEDGQIKTIDCPETLRSYKCLGFISQGTFGQVFKAQCRKTNKYVAIKRLKTHDDETHMPLLEDFSDPNDIREVRYLQRLCQKQGFLKRQVFREKQNIIHEVCNNITRPAGRNNIIELIELIHDQTNRTVNIVMQYVPLTLGDYLRNDLLRLNQSSPKVSRLDEFKRTFDTHLIYIDLTEQLLSGLAYIHDTQIIHRDLKPGNILVDFNKQKNMIELKIADFGCARSLYADVLNHDTSQVINIKKQTMNSFDECLSEGLVTLWYRAPEILLGKKLYDQSLSHDNKVYFGPDYSYSSDMWSIGCILMEFIFVLLEPAEKLKFNNLIYPKSFARHPRLCAFMTGQDDSHQRSLLFYIFGMPDFCKWPLHSVHRHFINENPGLFSENPRGTFGKLDTIIARSKSTPLSILLQLSCRLLSYNPKKRYTAMEALEVLNS